MMMISHIRCLTPRIRFISTTRQFSLNVAIVGSGPAGFYTTQKLLRDPRIKVDIYEKLPVPFGLVRYGVAPDHGDVKNVINTFTSVANHDRVNFYGNVSLGQDIRLDDLIEAYHAVVLCYGSAQDKMLNIPGENESKILVSARNFVGWYNGVPEDKDLKLNLDCDTACVIGNGNVALDCARILRKPANLEKTDITSYAQKRISESRIKRIFIIGRRGPLQASFTTKELRELISLNGNKVRLEPYDVFRRNDINLKMLTRLSRPRRRLAELLISIPPELPPELSEIEGVDIVFKFLSKPIRINDNSLELQKTNYKSPDDFINAQAHPEDEDDYEVIDCGLIIRSIGYKAIMIDKNLPFNHKLGAILNDEGRVHGHRSVYCSGWLATGASGVIAGTLSSSHITAKSILNDVVEAKLPNITRIKPGYEMIGNILKSKSVQVVHFNQWLRIDELEKELGKILGKTREKLVDFNKMLETARR